MKNPSIKNFLLWEIYNNNKTKSEKIMNLPMQWIAHVNLLAWVPAHARAIAHVSGNIVYSNKTDINSKSDIKYSNK